MNKSDAIAILIGLLFSAALWGGAIWLDARDARPAWYQRHLETLSGGTR